METINNVLSEFLNIPVVATIITIITSVGGILAILAKTTLGKKALKKLTKLHEEKNEKLEEANEKLKEANEKLKEAENQIKELIENKDEIINSYKEEADAKYQLLYDDLNKRITLIFDCLTNVNNDKVQNIVNNYKTSLNEEKEVVISEIVKKADAYEAMIKRVEELEQYVKEAIDNKSTEEEIQ